MVAAFFIIETRSLINASVCFLGNRMEVNAIGRRSELNLYGKSAGILASARRFLLLECKIEYFHSRKEVRYQYQGCINGQVLLYE